MTPGIVAAHERHHDQVCLEASIIFWLDHGRDQHVFAFASADSLARLPVLAFRDERAEVGCLRVDQSVTDLCGLANLGPGRCLRAGRGRDCG